MKKALSLLLCLTLGCCACPGALAEGVTLRTVSCFAGLDASSSTYTRLLAQWEEQTGNTVQDASAPSDESWKTGVLLDFAAGNEPDVLFFFARTADSAYLLNRVVPIAEINAAYPELNIPENEACTETDGKIYAVPVRSFWEGLFCNTDLFAKYGLPLPTTWALLENAIRVFKRNDIVPISASLSDVPHYVAEFTILASGTIKDYLARPGRDEAVPQSWVDGMALIRELYKLGAFPENVNTTSESYTSQLFREKRSAMQLDGSWFANSLPASNMDTTVVIPFPSRNGDESALIGGVSMGFYLTRRAWEDASKRDAAVQLLAYLSTGDNARTLGGYQFSGELLKSSYTLTENALYGPIQDQMSQEARNEWFRLIPSVANGSVSPADVWTRVMELNPFSIGNR
ncbi:MAG TPA: extracellular solute-binding protein [Candidatus Limiplasma sp.]|nr:extracellular solute-binding protein [Candidatus Limiplasma sp.]